MATLNGSNVFGYAVRFKWLPNPTAQQVNEFFGVSGLQSLFGGERGSILSVEGTFFGPNAAIVIAQESLLLSYRDGIARTLVDDWGTVYPDFVFSGRYQRDDNGVKPGKLASGITGWCLRYQCTFEGL